MSHENLRLQSGFNFEDDDEPFMDVSDRVDFGYSRKSPITYYWSPRKYEVSWADSPQEAGVLDWTSVVLKTNDYSNEAKASMNRFVANTYDLPENDIHVRETLGVRFKEFFDVPNKHIEAKQTALKSKFVLLQLDSKGSIEPTIKDCYPRLVQSSQEKASRPKERPKVSKAIAKLKQYCEDETQLKEEILKVANEYSVLSYRNQFDDTLEGWHNAIKEMSFWYEIFAIIKRNPSSSKEDTNDDNMLAQSLHEYFEIKNNQIPPHFGRLSELLRRQDAKNRQADELIEFLYKQLWRNFAGRNTDDVGLDMQQPTKYTIRCGSLGWAYLELSQMLPRITSNKKFCIICETQFQGHGNKNTCSIECKNIKRKRDQNQRRRKAKILT